MFQSRHRDTYSTQRLKATQHNHHTAYNSNLTTQSHYLQLQFIAKHNFTELRAGEREKKIYI